MKDLCPGRQWAVLIHRVRTVETQLVKRFSVGKKVRLVCVSSIILSWFNSYTMAIFDAPSQTTTIRNITFVPYLVQCTISVENIYKNANNATEHGYDLTYVCLRLFLIIAYLKTLIIGIVPFYWQITLTVGCEDYVLVSVVKFKIDVFCGY